MSARKCNENRIRVEMLLSGTKWVFKLQSITESKLHATFLKRHEDIGIYLKANINNGCCGKKSINSTNIVLCLYGGNRFFPVYCCRHKDDVSNMATASSLVTVSAVMKTEETPSKWAGLVTS